MHCGVHKEPASLRLEFAFGCPDSDWTMSETKQCSYGDEEVTPVAHSVAEYTTSVPPTGLKDIVHVEKQAMKRSRVEKSNISDVSNGTTRKRTKCEPASPRSNVGKRMEVEPRVGCPYYKHDPKNNRTSACKGKRVRRGGKVKVSVTLREP
jgi:hypothetical protein